MKENEVIEQIGQKIQKLDSIQQLWINQDHLRVVNLAHNAIESVPAAFFDSLPSLEKLNLFNNRLHVLPNTIFKCKVSILLYDLAFFDQYNDYIF